MLYQDEEKFDNRALFDLPDKSIRRSNGYKLNLSKFRVKNKTHFQQWKYIYLLGLLAKDWFSDIWSFKILFGDLLFILLDFFCLFVLFFGFFFPQKKRRAKSGCFRGSLSCTKDHTKSSQSISIISEFYMHLANAFIHTFGNGEATIIQVLHLPVWEGLLASFICFLGSSLSPSAWKNV